MRDGSRLENAEPRIPYMAGPVSVVMALLRCRSLRVTPGQRSPRRFHRRATTDRRARAHDRGQGTRKMPTGTSG
ncbi:Uncharacterized protein FWK35_00019900 [Aphis craccivora]|uniref:Uncharacterized protein n=1 Tax=Aphis craccivora TaxID=307492 RepID=A0A6G0Z1J7_APHCR|nr:Uncharacterized protein FWK35_00019900 [Aphis craccivora]